MQPVAGETSEEMQKVTIQQARPAKQPAKSYTVQPNDSLWLIAKKQLGDGGRYREIATLNGLTNPNLIYPGQVLILGD